MILIPAVDILDGKAVRLTRGSFDAPTLYDADPVEAALRWEAEGARALHVVDLNGARTGAPVNLEVVRQITERLRIPVEVGGGLRTIDAVVEAIETGATRVVLGTAALDDIDLLDEALARLGDRVVVSVDARNQRPATRGWTEELEVPIEVVLQHLGERGVRRFVYSSIDRDGTLTGPDLKAAHRVANSVRGTFFYSGGISGTDDLRALAELRQVNLAGVIVGKALYERRFSVTEGQRALDTAAHADSEP